MKSFTLEVPLRFLCWDAAPASCIFSLETRDPQQQAGCSQSEQGLDVPEEKEPKLRSCGFCSERSEVWGGAQGPSQQQEQKPSTCSVVGAWRASGSDTSWSDTGAHLPFHTRLSWGFNYILDSEPRNGDSGTPEIPRAVTHLSVQPPHTLTTRHTTGPREVGGHPLASELV